jgi:hypothetical protein
MAYLVLMLSISFVEDLESLVSRACSYFSQCLIPAQEIKTQQGMQIQIAYSKVTYLTDQGMLS